MKYFNDKNFEEKEELNYEQKDNMVDNLIPKENKMKFSYLICFILISVFLGIAILIITLFIDKNAFSTNANYTKLDNAVIKAKSDHRNYRTLFLKNGLEAVIISDPLTITSGASLSVSVGSNKDPDNLMGLAHFCEHMLFLGSKKYPNGDDYYKTISENNGVFNAHTKREITNYFFDIHHISFEKALDIFSRFFIDPLFNEEKLNKEINSVHSEFERNMILDSKKRSQVFSDLMKKDSPFHKFTTGNIDSLVKNAEKYGLNLRDELIKFHKNFYVAEKMKLIIYSNEDPDDIEEMIVEKFSEIKSSPQFILNKTKEKKKDDNFMKNTKNLSSSNNQSFYPNYVNQLNNTFVNPFHNEVLGGFVEFNAKTTENELAITFIQKSLSNPDYFYSNPYYYYYNIFDNKDENSLIDLLKKEKLATTLSATNERDFLQWSDLMITIKLTNNGMNNIQRVLEIINSYIKYMKENLISENYYLHLQKVAKMNLEYKKLHTESIYEMVAKIGCRFHNYPIQYILDEIHLINAFNKTILLEYADSLKLENSLIFLSYKSTKGLNYPFLINGTRHSKYEPWYKTNYTYSKINFDLINTNINHINFTENNLILKPIYEDYISHLINETSICNTKCTKQLKEFQTSKPSLLNKTSRYEFWYKQHSTLDFNKAIVYLQFQYETKKNEDKIYFLILQSLLKKRFRLLNTKLNLLSNAIEGEYNNFGIQMSYTSFKININNSTNDFLSAIQLIINSKELNDFSEIIQELHEDLQNDYNAQPLELSYEYIQKNSFNDFMTSEEYLKILPNISLDNFKKFLNEFKNGYYIKLLIFGDIQESLAKEVFLELAPILFLNSTNSKNSSLNLQKEEKQTKSALKQTTGNFLIRKVYHEKINKNNVLIKCYKIGPKDYKNEVMIKLFDIIIGNIVFRELRTNRQFGYRVGSKVELFNNYYFYCIFAQGSSKLPHIIDEATIELLETKTKSQIETISQVEFNLAKRKNIDILTAGRYDLSQVSYKYFYSILVNDHEFLNFKKIEKFSKSILKTDMLNFFKEKFLGNSNLKMTIYMYSQQVNKDMMKLNAQKGTEYKEIE